MFFLAVHRGTLRTGQLVAGHFLGIGALICVSLAAALGLTVVPDRWVGLLGVVPLALGVRGLVTHLRGRREQDDDASHLALSPGGFLGVAGVTVANGADNIAAYTPVFRSLSPGDTAVTVMVFAVMTGVWLLAARLIGSRRGVLAALEGIEPWLVPTVFIVLGVAIIAESGVVAQVFR